jgi:dTDP-4-dehydrorhamnose reductase
MRILLTGASGQVGYELARSLQGLGEVFAPGRAELDLADLDQVRAVVRAARPDLIVNPAAYTAVDRAESEPALAMRLNAEAPAVLAQEARALGAALVHYSTDYVFDGGKDAPYLETDPTGPLSVYGRSKLAGEQAIAAAGCAHLILRTSWVYGMRGKNFLLTMLQLAREHGKVRVVADQFGAPTWSRTVAEISAHLLAQARAGGTAWWEQHGGIYHLSSRGETSWHGFAEAIMMDAGIGCEVQPVSTAGYPTPAPRPRHSRLCCDKLAGRHIDLPEWRDALRLCLG